MASPHLVEFNALKPLLQSRIDAYTGEVEGQQYDMRISRVVSIIQKLMDTIPRGLTPEEEVI